MPIRVMWQEPCKYGVAAHNFIPMQQKLFDEYNHIILAICSKCGVFRT